MTVRITFPISRLIGGSVSKLTPRTEADGKTIRLNKDGTAMEQINFGIAIPKGGETHWSQTPWGKPIHDLAVAAYPVLHKTHSFAWKITDGDSDAPNKNGKAPRAQDGYPGNWIIWFSQGWAPKLVNADGSVIIAAEAFKAGYYVQVLGDVASNGAQPPNTPGVYMNPVAVALSGEGEIIATEVDTSTVGFGGALPAGATPVKMAVEGFSSPATNVQTAAVVPPVVPVIPVVPNTAFMRVPPPPPAHVMLAAAQGSSYEQMVQNGWTDALLVQHGMMLA